MKRLFYAFTTIVAVMFMASSCGSADQMAKQAENVLVKCNPSPLCVKGGKVEADVEVTCPKNYFNSKAILEVTPVIVYEGGEVAAEKLMYQGDKVKDNYTVVPVGGAVVKAHLSFPYKEGMAKSTLELRGRCTTNGKKWVTLPVKKAADGCNITETLTCTKGCYKLKDSGYQSVISFNPEGQVIYKVNSSEVRASELKSSSIKAFQDALQEVANNDRKTVKDYSIVAYASPEGAQDLNERLSDNRSKSANKVFSKVTKKKDKVEVDVKSLGEDWNGFKELVENSNLADKNLILNVLSMYSDPNVREREIKNMASVYQDLAKDILPLLRRARFIANVEYKNYTEEELQDLIKNNVEVLDEPALLKAAEISSDVNVKMSLYRKAADKFKSAKAKFNMVCVSLDENKLDQAKKEIKDCDAKDADVINLQGVIALREGDLASAKASFEKAKTGSANCNLGIIALLSGDYATAAAKCGDKGLNAAIAQILNGNCDAALKCLDNCGKCAKCPKVCAMADYVRAIAYARKGDNDKAKEALAAACKADKKLAERAKTDIEFAKL